MSALAWPATADVPRLAAVPLTAYAPSSLPAAELTGFRVAAFGSLESALREIPRQGADVILATLDRLDEAAAARAVLLASSFPDLPVVALAPEDDPELAGRLLRGGLQDWIVRPEDAAGTVRRLKLAIERHRRDRGRVRVSLDRVPFAVILAASSGRVFQLNQRAEALVAARRGLRLEQGMLHAAVSSQTAGLREAVRAACAASAVPGGTLLAIDTGRATGEPLAVQVTPSIVPFRASADAGTAMVVVREPVREPTERVAALQSVYRLTAAEARVAALLMCGHSVQDSCRLLDITIHTGRTHLKRVLDKTGARRQGELVALLWMEAAFV